MISTSFRGYADNARRCRVKSTLTRVWDTQERVWDTLYQPKPIMPNTERQALGRSREPTAPMNGLKALPNVDLSITAFIAEKLNGT